MEYGLWVESKSSTSNSTIMWVLILVLMEYGLWDQDQPNQVVELNGVLILVLMEYGLWVWDPFA